MASCGCEWMRPHTSLVTMTELHRDGYGQIVSWMPLALKRSPSCRLLWRRRAGKALLTHAPTSNLGSWPSNSQSGTQEAAHHA
eukprot:2244774-Amphidinium_carterae.1